MSALLPGMYRETVNGVPDVTVMKGRDEMAYLTGTGHLATRRITWDTPTDARPLIVLDLTEAPHINGPGKKLDPVAWLRTTAVVEGKVPRGGLVRWLADQIEAQTKPARIPEPKHVGASVSAYQSAFEDFAPWTRFSTILLANWIDAAGRKRRWTDLIDPTLIREGVPS